MKVFFEQLGTKTELAPAFAGTDTYLEGIFGQIDTVNRNLRIYPMDVMIPAVDMYVKTRVDNGHAIGELDHPDEAITPKMSNASHLITELRIEGDLLVGKAKIAHTTIGDMVKGLIDTGVNISMSTRGVGTSEENDEGIEVMELFYMTAIDIVSFPSAHMAIPRVVNEAFDFLLETGYISKSAANHIAKQKRSNYKLLTMHRRIDEAVSKLIRSD